jgi:hypothetical protein
MSRVRRRPPTPSTQRVQPSVDRARRFAVALPACFVVFDLLAHNGLDLRTRPYSRRRRALEKLLARHLPDRLTLMPMTTDLAAASCGWSTIAPRASKAWSPSGSTRPTGRAANLAQGGAPERQRTPSWAAWPWW